MKEAMALIKMFYSYSLDVAYSGTAFWIQLKQPALCDKIADSGDWPQPLCVVIHT